MSNQGKRDFFVSYAGADRPWAQWAAGALEADGYTVELDVWDWAPGTNAIQQMNGALERAQRVLALWSPRYFDPSSFAGEELTGAFYANHEVRGRLVPIVIEKVKVGPLYKPLIFIDLSEMQEADATRELLSRLRGETGRGQQHRFPRADQASPVRFPGQRPPVWRAPPRNPNFTARDRMLEDLHGRLRAAETVVLEALHGMGGVGKTQLATEYAHRFAPDYDVVWWIDAEQPALIPDQFADLAAKLGVGGELSGSNAVDAVLDTLGDRTGWLLVFDNAEHPGDLKAYRPSGGHGQVLVTSRHPGWGGLGGRVEVDVFARPESVLLLERRIPELSTDLANDLAAELGDLPLALEQAAGYIETKGTPPEHYLRLLRAQRDRLLREGSVADHVLLDATWALSLEQLQRDEPAAVQLLQLVSFLAPEPVPLEALREGASAAPEPLASALQDEFALDATLGRLSEYSLIRRTADSLQVHRLVQASVRGTLSADEQDAVLASALRLLRESADRRGLEVPDAWPLWRSLLPHILALTHERGEKAERIDAAGTSWLLDRAGIYLDMRGEPGGARPLLERALLIDEGIYGEDDPALTSALINLATVLRALGEPTAARALVERALRIDEQAYGPDHPEVAVDLSNLASVLQDLGEPVAALPLLERALGIAEQTYGPDHPTVAKRLNNLANVLGDLGESAAARPLLERALRITEQAHGPQHPDVATSLSNLALVLQALDDPGAARPLVERALHVTEQTYGPDHPTLPTYLNNLALLLQDLGEPAAARPLLERALRITEQVHGPVHRDVATSQNNLASALLALDDPDAARPLIERALDIGEQVYGPDHPTVGTYLNNLALLLQGVGEPAAARPLLERSLRIAEQVYGPTHATVTNRLNRLASVLGDLGERDAAQQLLERSSRIADQSNGD